jgi:hypothetical protein
MMPEVHRQWLLAGILALSPLAYLGSMLIERALPARTNLATIDEAEALRIARGFAESRQIDTRGWRSAVGTESDDDLVAVFRRRSPAALEGIASPSTIHVLWQTVQGDRSFGVTLTPLGRVIGFAESKSKEKPVTTDPESARALAETFLRARLAPDTPFHLEFVEPKRSGKESDKDNQDRAFTWRADVPGVPKTTATFHVDTYGNRVIAARTRVAPGDEYLKQLKPHEGWLTALKVVAWVYIIALGLYSIVRYCRRAADKEVSHRRTALAALAYVLLSLLFVFDPGYMAGFVGAQLGRDRTFLVSVMAAFYCLLGAFFGVAYGAGEGGLRETYPGKLTSLDALLSGKIFSANVARSILVGGGVAGWLLLAQNLILLAAHGNRVGADHGILASAFYRFPLLALLGERATDSVFQTTFGLLLPIALLRPRIGRSWIFFGLLPLFSILPATVTAGDEALWATFLSVQLALVAAVFVPFFSRDLLAAICGIFAVRFVGGLIQRGVATDAWQHIFLRQVAPAGVAFLLAQVYFAWRGETYEEYEVRPRYARYLAEHQALEAEIDAARLAQLRLLPGAPPRIDALSVAGSCIPAREVGGDFFDFYEIDAHRLGVFLAEGGSRELGSAMPIALAKGYLLYAAGLDLSPAEILRRLYKVIGPALHGNASLSVMYAVIDARARTVRFARTGDSPRLSINGSPAAEELAGDAANGPAIRHGVAALAARDALFFYTDGLAAQIAERKRQWTDRFLKRLVGRLPDCSAAQLEAALIKAAIRGKQNPPDDVTAVVVRVEEPHERAIEVVA